MHNLRLSGGGFKSPVEIVPLISRTSPPNVADVWDVTRPIALNDYRAWLPSRYSALDELAEVLAEATGREDCA